MEFFDIADDNRFGRWTVLERAGAQGGRWKVQCDCGAIRVLERNAVASGHSQSCGCLQRERSAEASRRTQTKHGMEGTPEYRTWVDMRRRCHDPRRPDFKNYGARGISVCEEWRESFEAFYRDMGRRPEGHTLDRLNNAGPYSKQNCVWAERKHQERNKRTNRVVHLDGRRMTIAEGAEIYGIRPSTVWLRLDRGWSVDDAFKKPSRQQRPA